MNDEAYYGTTPEGRWKFIREWATSQLKPADKARQVTGQLL